MAIEVIHERTICIGCGACAVLCPKHWEMADDGKATLKKSERTKNGENIIDTIVLDENEGNAEAAESCPVDCIRVKEEK